MSELTGKVGFASPYRDNKICKRRAAAIELFATVSLAVSLAIAATAVSIGMAHAQALGAVSHGGSAPVALFVGVALVGVGGLAARATRRRSARE